MWRRLALASAGVAAGLLGQAHCAAIASSSPPSRASSLAGTTAIVTGGSKGLGRAIVEELLAQGCEVTTCARDLAPLGPLLASETRLSAVEADVSTEEGRATLIDAMRARFGAECALDILVNNVGTNVRKPSVEYSPAEFNDLMSTNVASALHLSTACQPEKSPCWYTTA